VPNAPPRFRRPFLSPLLRLGLPGLGDLAGGAMNLIVIVQKVAHKAIVKVTDCRKVK
jgi:hypothetical protein